MLDPTQNIITIGSSPICDICIKSSSHPLEPVHSLIVYEKEQWVLKPNLPKDISTQNLSTEQYIDTLLKYYTSYDLRTRNQYLNHLPSTNIPIQEDILLNMFGLVVQVK